MNNETRKYIDEAIARAMQAKFDTYNFDKHINLLNGVDIRLGGDKGTRIGISTNDKLGFYGATPVTRQTNPGTATGTDAGVINNITNRLQTLGLIV